VLGKLFRTEVAKGHLANAQVLLVAGAVAARVRNTAGALAASAHKLDAAISSTLREILRFDQHVWAPLHNASRVQADQLWFELKQSQSWL